ncbi:MAG: heme NO-binding domain-containing protein [Candidatus Nanopelagicales bacterium]
MKGVIFTEFLQMVETVQSPDLVDELIDSVDLPSGGAYTAVGTYDHAEIVALVTELSQRTGIPVPDLLSAFGEFLFGRFVELYPSFFEGQDDPMDFLSSIEDVIHAEVLKLYPDAQLPRIDAERHGDDELELVYRSPRRMGDVAEGLCRGALTHFGVTDTMTMRREDVEGDDPHVRFTLTR